MLVPFTGEKGSYVGYASVETVCVQEEISKTKIVRPAIDVIALRNMTGILPKIVMKKNGQ
jgi:hypothetical protein